jgi:hypothetical protein
MKFKIESEFAEDSSSSGLRNLAKVRTGGFITHTLELGHTLYDQNGVMRACLHRGSETHFNDPLDRSSRLYLYRVYVLLPSIRSNVSLFSVSLREIPCDGELFTIR